MHVYLMPVVKYYYLKFHNIFDLFGTDYTYPET